jgi:hypothetical protein
MSESRQISMAQVSPELWRQVHIDAEASGLTVRVWALRALRRACGLPEEGEIERAIGRPKQSQRTAEEQERVRRERIEARPVPAPAICGPARRAGELFICRLPAGHAGDRAPDAPSPATRP